MEDIIESAAQAMIGTNTENVIIDTSTESVVINTGMENIVIGMLQVIGNVVLSTVQGKIATNTRQAMRNILMAK